MSEETVVAVSSPAEVEDVFRGETPTLDEFNTYRQSGELPERFKTAEDAESATANTQQSEDESDDADQADKDKSEHESDTDADKEAQEQAQKGKPKTAEDRIAQLEATIEKIRKGAGLERKTEVAPVTQQPQIAQQHAHPRPTPEDTNPDGTLKYSTYEDLTEAVARWAAKEERTIWELELAQKEAQKALSKTLEEARSRYEDADDVIFPAAKAINEANIPQVVKEVFAQSENFIDLCYVVGSDQDELNKFVKLAQTNPRAAIGKVFEYERGIKEELGKPESGNAPETKKTTAPKPPSPVGGASSRAFDVSDESLSPEEWMRKRNADLARKRG